MSYYTCTLWTWKSIVREPR